MTFSRNLHKGLAVGSIVLILGGSGFCLAIQRHGVFATFVGFVGWVACMIFAAFLISAFEREE